MRKYELAPADGRKSFYGKAFVEVEDNGDETLVSYGTRIITKKNDGEYVKHWSGWSYTTGRHIYAFCGMRKSEYVKVKEG